MIKQLLIEAAVKLHQAKIVSQEHPMPADSVREAAALLDAVDSWFEERNNALDFS